MKKQKDKHIPMRTCIGCREQKPKQELVRVVLTPGGAVQVDGPKGKTNGRGAYVCPQVECFEKAIKKKAFVHVLKTKISEEQLGQVKYEFVQRLLEEDEHE